MHLFNIQKLFWNLHSFTWDEYLHATRYAEEISYIASNLRNLIQVKQPALLDTGCATGDFSLLFSKYCITVTGIDYADGMLRKAKTKARLNKITNISFVTADFTKILPFPKNSFDVVFASHILKEISEPIDFLSEIRRVLTVNGYLVFVNKKNTKNGKLSYNRKLSKQANVIHLIKHLLFGVHGNHLPYSESVAEIVEQCGFVTNHRFETEKNNVIVFRISSNN